MQAVCQFFCVGSYCKAIPHCPEDLPPGGALEHMLALPQEPQKKSKVHFFMANGESDLK